MSRKQEEKTILWLLIPGFCFLAVWRFFPLGYSVFLSFFRWGARGAEDFVGFGNYAFVAQDPEVWKSFRIIFLLVGTVICVEFFLGLGIALLLNTLKKRGILTSIIIAPMLITPVVIGTVWRVMFHPSLGIINTVLQQLRLVDHEIAWLGTPGLALPAIMMADIWQWTPFVILLMLAGLQTIPLDPIEAARVDGATGWQIFIHVVLPLLTPVIFVVILLRTIEAFKIFAKVYVMTAGGPAGKTEVVSLRVYRTAFSWFNFGEAAALALIFLATIISCVIFIIFLGRKFNLSL